MTEHKLTGERGPVWGISLVDAIACVGNMMQAMPTRSELEEVREVSERTASCFEVLLSHYLRQNNRRTLDKPDCEGWWLYKRHLIVLMAYVAKGADGVLRADIGVGRPVSVADINGEWQGPMTWEEESHHECGEMSNGYYQTIREFKDGIKDGAFACFLRDGNSTHYSNGYAEGFKMRKELNRRVDEYLVKHGMPEQSVIKSARQSDSSRSSGRKHVKYTDFEVDA